MATTTTTTRTALVLSLKNAPDATRKDYRMVIAAGGPGIGQRPFHTRSLFRSYESVYACADCFVYLSCAVPGKTTWARYAFAADGASSTSTSGKFHRSLRDTHRHQAMYRILYEHVCDWEKHNAKRFIAGRLLHQFLEYRVQEGCPVE